MGNLVVESCESFCGSESVCESFCSEASSCGGREFARVLWKRECLREFFVVERESLREFL